MSKFDIILIMIGLIIVGACVADFWLILHGLPEFGAGFWSVILGISGGEVVTFSIYRMVKKSSDNKVSTTLTSQHTLIKAIEEEEKNDVETDKS